MPSASLSAASRRGAGELRFPPRCSNSRRVAGNASKGAVLQGERSREGQQHPVIPIVHTWLRVDDVPRQPLGRPDGGSVGAVLSSGLPAHRYRVRVSGVGAGPADGVNAALHGSACPILRYRVVSGSAAATRACLTPAALVRFRRQRGCTDIHMAVAGHRLRRVLAAGQSKPACASVTFAVRRSCPSSPGC